MKILYFLLALIGVGAGIYWLVYPTYSWNQKLTVTINTPNGEKTGSAVVKAWASYQPQIFQANVRYGWEGEATIIDLGEGKYIFALLSNQPGLALDSFREAISGGKLKSFYSRLIYSRRKSEVKSERHYPMLVTFWDLNDPNSIILLNGKDQYNAHTNNVFKKEFLINPDNFEYTFGEGYSLKSMILEITDEPVTSEIISTVLPWLTITGGSISGRAGVAALGRRALADSVTKRQFAETNY